MRNALFALIVIGISILAGWYFLQPASKAPPAEPTPPADGIDSQATAPESSVFERSESEKDPSDPIVDEEDREEDEEIESVFRERTPDLPKVSTVETIRPAENAADPAMASAPVPPPAPPPRRSEEAPSKPKPDEAADAASSNRTQDARKTSEAETEAEAIRHIESVIDPLEKPIPVDRADHFVSAERRLSLIPEEDIERLSLSDMNADEEMAFDAPLTIVHDIEQSERVTAEDLLAEHEGDLEASVEVIEDDRVETLSVAETIERIKRAAQKAQNNAQDAEKSIVLRRRERHFEVTTLDRLQNRVDDADRKMSVIRKPYRLESAPLSRLIGKESDGDGDGDSIFYIHTVGKRDIDGIWGIIHYGLVDNFASGIEIERGDDTSIYRTTIPLHADELLDDRSSSYLGKLIHEKVRQSIVYNFREYRIGKNPDRIHPGQEILIVEFRPDELIDLYRYFTSGTGGDSVDDEGESPQ